MATITPTQRSTSFSFTNRTPRGRISPTTAIAALPPIDTSKVTPPTSPYGSVQVINEERKNSPPPSPFASMAVSIACGFKTLALRALAIAGAFLAFAVYLYYKSQQVSDFVDPRQGKGVETPIVRIHCPDKPCAYFSFCHGLHSTGTGAWPDPVDPSLTWMQTELAPMFPCACILNFEYDSRAVGNGIGSQPLSVQEQAKHFLAELDRMDLDKSAPFLWFGHSQGGLVLTDLVLQAENNYLGMGMQNSTKGMMFYGVPFRGSEAAFIAQVLPSKVHALVDVHEIVRDLRPLKPDWDIRLSHLESAASRGGFARLCIGETDEIHLNIPGTGTTSFQVVNEYSAYAGCPQTSNNLYTRPNRHADHIQVNKNAFAIDHTKRFIQQVLGPRSTLA